MMLLFSYGNMYCEWICLVLVAENREAKDVPARAGFTIIAAYLSHSK
jgi:hypothetical protein